MEIWKDIKGYEKVYQVCDQAMVKSLERKVSNGRGGFRTVKERILKTFKDKDGYNIVGLSLNGNVKTVKLYKLVAMAFLGHIPGEDGLEVDHKYPPNTDDRLSNLQLLTRRENCSKDQWRHNRSSKYVGVYFHKASRKWMARIKVNKKTKYLGIFKEEIEAHEAYQKALKNLS